MSRILIIEDERPMRAALADALEGEGYRVLTAADGEEGLARALSEAPDLILLDLMMPRLDGCALCAELRQRANTVPILILTAKGRLEDRVKGLDLGADDYLVKPFAFSELIARVRSLLRRSPAQGGEQLRVEDLELDTRRHRAVRAGNPLHLTSKEFLLLAQLVRANGEAVSRQEIESHVWGIDFQTGTNVLDVMVRRLRAKVDDPYPKKLIHTVRGTGYVLKAG